MNAALARLAAAAGIEPEYWDALGTRRELAEPTARAVLRALGFDPDRAADDLDAQALSLAGSPSPAGAASPAGSPSPAGSLATPAPGHCFIPESFAAGRRAWGIAVQLYSLRSARNWGIGDFTDLARIAVIAAGHGAVLVGLNPLHARHLSRPDEASPYSPSSRICIDPMYIDVEAVPDFGECDAAVAMAAAPAFRARLQTLRDAPLVDHRSVCEVKLQVLRTVFASFRATHAHADDSRRRDLAAFVLAQGEPLARFAEFEALRLSRAADGLPALDWQAWPDGWRDPDSAALARFRLEAADEIAFQMYLQWEAARQLDDAAAAARAGGLELALYRDLAVGAARDSAEAWGDQELIATRISVGAPPDQFSRSGQNWGLPPWNPRVLAARDYRPFAALLAANMAGAGALRIDHVMALMRLFWIPDGMAGSEGAYVRQPFDALAAVLAEESRRHRCMIIGEDLGSVPDGLRERLHGLGLLSYRVLLFERHWESDGRFRLPGEYPQQALATVATHDMPTIADFWRFGDIARRAALGLFQDDAAREQEIARRHDERWKVLALLHDLGLAPADPEDTQQIAEALHAAVARTPSMLAVVQLDDVLGETEPANIPGTNREYPNWRRKLSRTLDEIACDPRLERLASIMEDAGRRAKPEK